VSSSALSSPGGGTPVLRTCLSIEKSGSSIQTGASERRGVFDDPVELAHNSNSRLEWALHQLEVEAAVGTRKRRCLDQTESTDVLRRGGRLGPEHHEVDRRKSRKPAVHLFIAHRSHAVKGRLTHAVDNRHIPLSDVEPGKRFPSARYHSDGQGNHCESDGEHKRLLPTHRLIQRHANGRDERVLADDPAHHDQPRNH
jgi:hypothetical protein